MSDTPLAVGDIVAVTHGTREVSKLRVARVLKRFVELSDGSKWSDGPRYHPYPRQDWGRSSMERWDDKHHRRPWLLGKLRSLTYRHEWANVLTDEELEQVIAIVVRASKEAREEQTA